MSVLVLFCLSFHVFIGASTDRQRNTNKTINRQTKLHQQNHQQIDKATPIKPSTDEQNNIKKNINRQTKQHLYVDVFIGVVLSICRCFHWCCFVYLLMSVLVLFCLSFHVFIGVVLSIHQ
jgi:Flp pilus assembly protein TadB